MSERATKDIFLESLNRCTSSPDFVPAFYGRFLNSSDAVAWKFRNTDFAKQNAMLEKSLRLVAGATSGEPEALRELKERAQSHDQDHLNISPDMYSLWKTAVVQTAKEFDTNWDDNVSEAWEKILGFVINYMIKHY